MRPLLRRVARLALLLAVVVVVVVIAGGVYARQQLRASLPIANGTLAIAGLSAPVTIDRDHLGVPTIAAASRADAARALGFLHAQERFFQMDLQRRQPAGELSALVGARAVAADRAARVHRFRHIAQKAIAQASPEYRALLDAYAAGVNAGITALGAPPFEYLALQMTPEPWKAEDSILTVLAMFNTLQGRQAGFEATFGTLADVMPPPMYEFLTARGSEWDAPIVGDRFPRPAIPGADVFDLRRGPHDASGESPNRNRPIAQSQSPNHPIQSPNHPIPQSPNAAALTPEESAALGSNNWAVAGAHTASGGALVANDMHLAISMPNIWYRAVMIVPDSAAADQKMQLAGITLPGIPSMVVGSNGHVAWGFTNTGGDWSDLVVIEADARDANQYLTPDGPRQFEQNAETIHVDGGEPQTLDVKWTIWGPIVRHDHRGRALAQKWVAHDASRLAADQTAPERARTVDEALRTAASVGIPAQNFVAGDRAGHIGWTIAGPIPRRVGFDGSRPTSWADGSRRWDGYLTADEYPRVVDPPAGRIWTANSPVVDGQMLAAIGEGGYADGIRARLIRDRLMAIERATPQHMLDVQLDHSALFHERWRALLLDTLTPQVTQGNALREEFRQLVASTWTGRAEPDSVAYRLVRQFRAVLAREVFNALTDPVKRVDRDFDFGRAQRSEGPLWQLVTARPPHLLDPAHRSWDAQLLAAVDTAIAELTEGNRRLADRTWGEFNRAVVTHPLAGGIPLVGRWLNMPGDPLRGDVYTPRAHSPRAGPSERFAVTPGREAEGILHMPGGQSGHPLSPHYADQHRAWVDGEPLPFLPGPSVSRLTLTPAQ